jgi:hypothetical protein
VFASAGVGGCAVGSGGAGRVGAGGSFFGRAGACVFGRVGGFGGFFFFLTLGKPNGIWPVP